MSNGRDAVAGSVESDNARIPAKGKIASMFPSSAPTTNIRFCRPEAISSKANPNACEDEAQAEEKPQDEPLILKCATRLNCTAPEIEATMPKGEQRMTPSLCIRSNMWPIRNGDPAEAA